MSEPLIPDHLSDEQRWTWHRNKVDMLERRVVALERKLDRMRDAVVSLVGDFHRRELVDRDIWKSADDLQWWDCYDE